MSNKFRSPSSYDPNLIHIVREKFMDTYLIDPDLYEEDDVKRVQEDPWFVTRFLFIHQNNEEAAAKSLLEAMKWRKENGYLHMKGNMFPDEFYRTGAMFPYEPDVSGCPVIFMRIKMLKNIPELKRSLQDFCSYQIFKVDEAAHSNGWTLVMDAEGAGYQNADLDLLKYLVTTLKNYFPGGLNHLLVVDCPWILKAFWSLIRNLIPSHRRDMVKFVSRKEITKFISQENLPDFMGGKCERRYNGWSVVPEGSPHGVDFLILQDDINGNTNPIEVLQAIFEQYREFLEVDHDDH